MRDRRRWIGIIASVATLCGLGFMVAPASAAASSPIFRVMNTSETPPDGVWFRNSPHTADTDRVTGHGVYAGDQVQLQCYAWGDAIGAYNNTLWYYVSNVTRPTVPTNGQPNVGFLNAHYIDDGQAANALDAGVPACINNLPPTPAANPTVSLAQGAAAPAGYRYAITLSGFAANRVVAITCYDSASPGGFYAFSLTTDGAGNASTAAYCYSGDGPDHWVVAGGIESNHVTWASSGGDTSPPTSAGVTLAQGPAATSGHWYSIALTGFAPAARVAVTCYDSVSPSGFITFNVTTGATGSATSQSGCFSGDGPDHWVSANGVQSNHVSWSGGSSNGGGGENSGGTGNSGYRACHIQVKAGAGARERQILSMSGDLNTAAKAAGVDCQTLAHIIYHEGGNYLSIRRSATQVAELSGPMASVGIGQMTIPTAKLVALKIYSDWQTVFADDIVVRASLIYDIPFALKMAAGYVKLLEEAGVAGDFQLFMSYSLSVTGAKAWRATGYSMNRAVLSTIKGLRLDKFIPRQNFYKQAVRAIG